MLATVRDRALSCILKSTRRHFLQQFKPCSSITPAVNTDNDSFGQDLRKRRADLQNGPPLEHFIANSGQSLGVTVPVETPSVPYIRDADLHGHGRKGDTVDCMI